MSKSQGRSQAPSNRKQRKEAIRAQQMATVRISWQRRRFALLAALIVLAVVIYAAVTHFTAAPADPAIRVAANTGSGNGLGWSRDGTQVLVGGTTTSGGAAIWDAATGTQLHQLYGVQQGITDLAWSPSGAYLAVGVAPKAGDAHAKLYLLDLWHAQGWIREPGTQGLRALTGSVARVLAFSPDSSLLAVQTADRIEVLSVPSLRIMASVLNVLATNAPHPILAWSPDSKLLAIGLTDSGQFNTVGIGILDARTLTTKRTIVLSKAAPGSFIGAAAWSPDGKRLAVGGANGQLTIFDPTTGHQLNDFGQPLHSITALTYAPDGMRLASGGIATLITLDTRTGKMLQSRDAPVDLAGDSASQNTVEGLAWSPNGTRLLITGNNTVAKIWTPDVAPTS